MIYVIPVLFSLQLFDSGLMISEDAISVHHFQNHLVPHNIPVLYIYCPSRRCNPISQMLS